MPRRRFAHSSTFLLPFLAACGSSTGDPASLDTSAQVEGIERGGPSARHDGLQVEHVLLLSIDGLHETDLARFIAEHPQSNLAKLAQTGVQYKNAWVNKLDGTPTSPTDSFPGLLALTTGAGSRTTGGWYDVSYARDLYPDASCAVPGTMAAYDEGVDRDNSGLWGTTSADAGPTHDVAVVRSRLDPSKLPYRKTVSGCSPVYPHDYMRVNTIFEVAHDAGLRTAWSDKHPAYEFVSGPSGTGVDDFFAPEINSLATNLPGTGAEPGQDFTTKAAYTKIYDDLKVSAILNQIAGKFSDDGLAGATDAGTRPGVPALFGMNFQAVSVSQKDAKWGPGGYLDASGTPSAELADALAHTDRSIGQMVDALKANGLLDATLVVVSAKHGQSPIDKSLVKKRDGDAIAALVDSAAPVAGHIEDDVAFYWLKDSQTADAGAAALLSAPADGSPNDPSVARVFTKSSPNFVGMFGDPTVDPRSPDIVVEPKKGTIYSLSAKKLAEHGGFADDDAHVGLLVSHPSLRGDQVFDEVRTKQVAPTILRALGLDPTRLQGVQKESTAVLPKIRFPRQEQWSNVRWTASEAPSKVTIQGGPWTLAELAPGTPVPPPVGTTLTNRSYGYCQNGVLATNPGTALMQPYYFPMVIGSGRGNTLEGFFDWRPKDLNEAIVAARSSDGGKSWVFQDEALRLTDACPLDITQTNPNADQADNGFGHPYLVEVDKVARLYVLDRSDGSIDNQGLVVNALTNNRRNLAEGIDHPLAAIPGTVSAAAAAGLVRTVGLLNPDGILGVVPESWPTKILYVQKQKGADNTGATALPVAQQCSPQPYLQPGAKKPRAANHDIVTVRLASTTDGVHFEDLGPVAGLNDSTTVSYLGTRWVAPSGTIVSLDGGGHYGLFFAGGNCLDADSDAFHYIGYAESTDLKTWNVINGIDNPIASLAANVVLEGGATVTIPAQAPVVGPALAWFGSRVYSPSVVKLDSNRVALTFAGYEVQSPNSDLLHYRQIGNVVLESSQPLRGR